MSRDRPMYTGGGQTMYIGRRTRNCARMPSESLTQSRSCGCPIPRSHRPTTRTSILPFLGILGSCLGPVASGEPGEALLPVWLPAGHRPSGSALRRRYSAVHPRPPQPPWPLAGAPAAGGWVPDSIGRGQGARDRDHEPAAQGGNPLSPGSPDRRDPGLSRGGHRAPPMPGQGAVNGSRREIALARSGSMGTAGFGPWTR